MNSNPAKVQAGLTLVELMVAMAIGMLLILAVSNIFLAQRQAYRVNENLAHMQDSGRTAFELMARELREAGGNACGTTRIGNVVNGASGSIWLDWERGGVEGFDGGQDMPGVSTGTEAAERVAGTDALVLRSASLNEGVIITDHQTTSAQFKVNTTTHGFVPGDIVMACDYRQAAILQITNASSSNSTIVHNTGAGTPGNCSKGLGFPTDCDSVVGNEYSFEGNGFLNRLTTSAWFIGNNDHGGRSLFRIVNDGAAQEIAEGVADMQLEYLTRTGSSPASDYVDAMSVDDWANDASSLVIGVRVTLQVESRQNVGVDAGRLSRRIVHVVSLRHREIVQ